MQLQSTDESKIFEKAIKKTSLYSNIIFLVCHIAYLILFFSCNLPIMGWINLGSIVYYLLLFILIKVKKYNLFAKACGSEIALYMGAGTMICGIGAGFHICFIGNTILAFYSGYFAKKRGDRINPIFWGVAFLLMYLFVILYCVFIEPVYKLDVVLNTVLFIGHVFVVFAFITLFLHTFIKYVYKLESRIIKESRTDKLTQIPNRYGLYDYYESIDDKNSYALAIFDIDDFKKINDKYGHQCGDFILQEITRIANTDNEDFVARYGGEEFIVIRKIESNYEDTCNKIDEIRKNIENHQFVYEGKSITTTVTMGVSQYNEKKNSIEDWITVSDMKLYEGKNSGKNKTVI